jgi:hypothetical protein
MAESRAGNCKLPSPWGGVGGGVGVVCVGWKCNEREKGQLEPSGHVLGGLSCILMHERMVAFVPLFATDFTDSVNENECGTSAISDAGHKPRAYRCCKAH